MNILFVLFALSLLIAFCILTLLVRTFITPMERAKENVGYCTEKYLNIKNRPVALIATRVPVSDKSGRRVEINAMFFCGLEQTTETLHESIRELLENAESLDPLNTAEYLSHSIACATELNAFLRRLITRVATTRDLSLDSGDGHMLAFFRVVFGDDFLVDMFRHQKDHNEIGVANFLNMIRENWIPTIPSRPIMERARTAIRVHTSRRQRATLPGNAS